MLFSRASLLSGAAALFSFATIATAADCGDSGPFAIKDAFGHAGSGGYYCASKWDAGLTVTGIEAWADQWHLNGLQLTFSDGSSQLIGHTTQASGAEYHKSISWGQGAKVTYLELNKSADGKNIAKINIEVTDGSAVQKLEVGHWVKDGNHKVTAFGSGVLLGAEGGAGDTIDNITFLFLRSNSDKAEIVGVTFDQDLDEFNKQLASKDLSSTIDELYIINGGTVSLSGMFANDLTNTKIVSSSFSESTSIGEAVTIGVSVGFNIPTMVGTTASVSSTTSFNMETIKQSSVSNSVTKTMKWSMTVPVDGGKAMHCLATSLTGTYKSDYTSTVRMTLSDGKTFDVKQRGTFSSVGWSDATAACAPIAIKDVPTTGNAKIKNLINGKRQVQFRA